MSSPGPAGSGWAVIAQQPFVAETAGKVVAGDGTATASTRVEADEIRFAINRVTVNPNVDNIRATLPVRNIVQSWGERHQRHDPRDRGGAAVGPVREQHRNLGKDLAEYQVHRSVFQSFTPPRTR